MKKRGIRIRKGLYIVLWMGTLFSLILCLGIAFGFFTKDTFNKLGYKAKINTHTTSYIN